MTGARRRARGVAAVGAVDTARGKLPAVSDAEGAGPADPTRGDLQGNHAQVRAAQPLLERALLRPDAPRAGVLQVRSGPREWGPRSRGGAHQKLLRQVSSGGPAEQEGVGALPHTHTRTA